MAMIVTTDAKFVRCYVGWREGAKINTVRRSDLCPLETDSVLLLGIKLYVVNNAP